MAVDTERNGTVHLEDVMAGGKRRWQVEKLATEWSDPPGWNGSGSPKVSRFGDIRIRPRGVSPTRVTVQLTIKNPDHGTGHRTFDKYEVKPGGAERNVIEVDEFKETIKGTEWIRLWTNPARRGTGDAGVKYVAKVFVDGVPEDVDPDITIRDPGFFLFAEKGLASFNIRTEAVEPASEDTALVEMRGRIVRNERGAPQDEEDRGPVDDKEYFWAVYGSPDLSDLIGSGAGSAFRFEAEWDRVYWVVLAHNPDLFDAPDPRSLDRLVVRVGASSLPEEG